MKPEAQWYLVEALSRARGDVVRRDDDAAKQLTLSHFAGTLAGFRYRGDVTQAEQQDWYRKMLVALDYEPPTPSPPGVSRAIHVGDPAKRPRLSPQQKPRPVFVRSQSGPDEEFEVHGGKIRIIAVEFYDSAVVFRWRVSPEPDVASAFPDEVAALEQDLEGLEEWAANDLRWKGRAQLKGRLYQFNLADDLDTFYFPIGHRYGSGSYGVTGEAEFIAPPPETSLLVFSWLGIEVPIRIA